MKKKYFADTEQGRIVVEGKNLKTLIVYLFKHNQSIYKYRSVSTKANNKKNWPYLKKLFTHKDTDTGLAYGADCVQLYDLEELCE